MRELSLNDIVLITVTPKAREILHDDHLRRVGETGAARYPLQIHIDSSGRFPMPLWEVMRVFGPHIQPGQLMPIGDKILLP